MIVHLQYLRTNFFKLSSLRPCNLFPNSVRKYGNNSVDINTNVAKDVILYKYDNARFFKILNFFAISQFLFWSYLSVFTFKTLRDAPADSSSDAAWYKRVNLGENKYKNTLSCLAFLVGYGILGISWMYILKSVRYLILCKGGQKVTFVTYTPFGQNRIFTVNLKNISCKESRARAQAQLPIKVRGHYLHYIMDMKGEFKNPGLFDYTAGLKRKWPTST